VNDRMLDRLGNVGRCVAVRNRPIGYCYESS